MSIITNLDFKLKKRFYAFIIYNFFINLIFSFYIKEINNLFIIIFKLNNLNDFNVFNNKIKAFLFLNIFYNIFIKIKYFNNNFYIYNKQFNFDFKSQN